MLDVTTFSNQHEEDAINVKVATMEICGECGEREEIMEDVGPITSDFSKCCEVTRGECRELNSGDTRHSDSDVDDVQELKDVKIVGVHKQQMPRRCFYFVILVMKSDGSNLTVYRQWKEIKAFQMTIRKSTKQDPLQAEASYYLNNLRLRSSLPVITLHNGAMKRLRVVDSLNAYFQALVHYKELHRHENVREFFSPTEADLNSAFRCGCGRTYLYVTDSLKRSSSEVTSCDQSSESGSDQSDSTSQSSRDTNGDGVVSSVSTTTVSLARMSSFGFDVSSVEAQDTCQISSPMHGEMYVALEDHEPLDDTEKHILSFKKGDKMEVLMKNYSGWWFARCSHGNYDEERTGYVPATYLARDHGRFGKVQSAPILNVGFRNTTGRLLKSSKAFSPTGLHTFSNNTHSERNRASLQRFYTNSQCKSYVQQPLTCEYISKQSYTAENPDELSFNENSVFKVLQKNEDGWWLARYQGKEGLVPGVLLKKYCDPLHRLSLSVINLNVEV